MGGEKVDVNTTAQLLGNIGEFVAAIAVVASLLFVGFQVRQSDRTQRATSLQSVLDGHRDRTFAPLYASEDMADLWARGLTSFDDLSETEKRRFFSFMFEQCFQMQQVMQLHGRGLVPDVDYDAWLRYTAVLFECPGGRAIWPIIESLITPTVRDLMNEYREQNPNLPSYQDLNPLFVADNVAEAKAT
jgi:hypothetical protein